MLRSRFAIFVAASSLIFASSALAQTGAIGVRPGATSPVLDRNPNVAATATRVAAAKAPARASTRVRVRTAAKAPAEALEERGANPMGPFAKLSVPQRDSIIERTRELLGVRYRWAGINPARGLDCSGIVKYVFAKFGIELPHRAAELAKLGGSVASDTTEMRPGDLLVFGKKGKRISHVGIYVGDGMMIHASSSSKRVVETPVEKYRRPGGLQLRGVRRVIALDTVAVVEGAAEPILPPR